MGCVQLAQLAGSGRQAGRLPEHATRNIFGEGDKESEGVEQERKVIEMKLRKPGMKLREFARRPPL